MKICLTGNKLEFETVVKPVNKSYLFGLSHPRSEQWQVSHRGNLWTSWSGALSGPLYRQCRCSIVTLHCREWRIRSPDYHRRVLQTPFGKNWEFINIHNGHQGWVVSVNQHIDKCYVNAGNQTLLEWSTWQFFFVVCLHYNIYLFVSLFIYVKRDRKEMIVLLTINKFKSQFVGEKIHCQ